MDVVGWLRSLGLGQYETAFRENEITEKVLPSLTAEDLKEIGVGPVGHRRTLLEAIAALRADASDKAPSTDVGPPSSVASVAPEDRAERRQVTVMFSDLVGSTALSARMDPEDLREVISAYQTCVAETVGRLGGFVAKYMGDGVLVYFGYPQAHEDDAERAVRAGLGLIAAIRDLKTHAALQTRVGIATGLVVVGDLIGSGASQEQAIVGETPNLAARLQGVAEPNSVVIAESTRKLLGNLFDLEDLGAKDLKGIADPARAFVVLRPSSVESRFEAMRTAITPLVGRDEEIALLLRRWEQAKAGEGCVVLIAGEPGIGKSRVAQTIVERVSAEPHTRLRYFCSPHRQDSALYPSITALERAAGFRRDDTPTQRLDKLEAVLAQGTNDLSQAVPLFADLLSIPTGDRYPPLNLTPQKRKEKTLRAQLAQVEGLAARQPVLMVFEDIHWSDPTTRGSLDLFVDRIPTLRVLLIITFRPEFTPPWIGRPHVTLLSLNRLPPRQAAEMIVHVTGGKALPKEIGDKIIDRTDGVPLFIEELTKSVVESGLVTEAGDHYAVTGLAAPLAIPTTLHASLMARLDRLASVREVAQIGAVVGREFSHELLSAVAGLPREKLDHALGQLVQSGLVVCRGVAPQEVYAFKHVLVRDAAYAGLLRSRKAHLHAKIASVIEQRFPEIVEAEPETLAHHLTEAGLVKEAVGYWLRAGRNAAARCTNLEAIAHLRRGIETLGQLTEGPTKDGLDLNLQLALGPCLIATQPTSSAAAATFARARELCERLGDPPEHLRVLHWLMVALSLRGELPQGREASVALLGLAEARGDRPAMLNAMRGVGLISLLMGRVVEGREMAERTVKEFDASDEAERVAARAVGQDAGAAGLAVLSWALWLLGHMDSAVARMDAALQRADTVKDPHTQAYVCYYASILHALLGEPAVAYQHSERCFILSEEHGFRQWRSVARAIRDICTTVLEPSSDAIHQVVRGLDEYLHVGYQFGITALFVLLCEALFLRHRFDVALEVIEQGIATCDLNSERFFEAEMYRLKAEALLLGNESNAGSHTQSLLDKALTIARSQSARSLELRAALDLARLWHYQGKGTEARHLLAPIYGWFTEGFDTRDLKEAKALLEELS